MTDNMRLPRNNCYKCQFGCLMFTVDCDDGVTPFMIKCRTKSRPDRPLKKELTDERGECIGNATSCFYPKYPLPKHFKVEWEWVKPNESEIEQEFLTMNANGSVKEMQQWYADGHLMLRPRSNREPLYHDERKTQ